jgi:hypothetical protein
VLLWFLLACIPVLPVVLRAFVGDEEPDNAITQEQGGEPRKTAKMGLAA